MAHQINFKSYGVEIAVRSDAGDVLERIADNIGNVVPGGVRLLKPRDCEHLLDVKATDGEYKFKIYKNGENVASAADDKTFFNHINSQIRLTIAEFAVGKVFLHAGVVAWKGRAVIIPASSFAGKTTLVAALIKKGAVYYSDEYAVIDRKGLVSPFPKSLSMRGITDDYEQVDFPAESFGARVGDASIPIGLVLICQFDKSEKNQNTFAPEILSAGQGLLEILAHTIPIRFNPKFTLEILNKISSRAIITKSKRGEAEMFANLLIDFLDKVF